MAQLEHVARYDRNLQKDLRELEQNIWLGTPLNQGKAGNIRAVYCAFDLTSIVAGQTFAVEHNLGEVPLGFVVVGSQETSVIRLQHGTDAGGAVIPWSSRRIYLKCPLASDVGVKVILLLWGTDSGG